jgi:hypothetical protein
MTLPKLVMVLLMVCFSYLFLDLLSAAYDFFNVDISAVLRYAVGFLRNCYDAIVQFSPSYHLD